MGTGGTIEEEVLGMPEIDEVDLEEDLDEDIFRYGPKVIVMHWAVVITFMPLAFTGALLLRDWVLRAFNIFGGDLLLDTFEGALEVHVISALVLVVLGIVHVAIHLFQIEKSILPKDVLKEFRATLQTVLYATFISRRGWVGSSSKYKANQRMSYLATFYTLALCAVTSLFIITVGEAGSAMHAVAGVLVGLLAFYRILYLTREWDGVAIRCIFWKGTMPLWYIKENHRFWYERLKADSAPPAVEAKEPPTAVAAD
jgi:cytochrome b subunit of formate dehydrogenase